MKMFQKTLEMLVMLLLLASLNAALAAPPATLDYQGFLTDSGGAPIDGTVNVTFSIYDLPIGGAPWWSATVPLNVNQGVFSVQLGDPVIPFPAAMFDNALWLGIVVEGDAEMFPRRPIVSTAFTYKAQDANTLDGVSASALDQSAHVSDTNNPHNVTAAQVGALSSADLEVHAADASAHHTKTTSFADLTDSAADAQIPDDITVNQSTNADTVDNLNASSTPIPGWLLALDGGGKFPNSTLIMGPGSGLDADTVDGVQASAFSLSTHWHSSLNAADGNPANALYVNNAGLVGIGTTSPAEELHIVAANPRLLLQDTGLGNTEVNFRSNGTSDWSIYKHGASGNLNFYQSGDKVTIKDGTGNVGIGTTNPQTRLEVRDTLRISETSSTDFLQLRTTGGALDIEAFNHPLYINGTSGQDTYILGGNVGIGTTSPEVKLHVNGLAKFVLNTGSISMSTPGGNPGMIAFASNGHRRDMIVHDSGIVLAVSDSSSAPNSSNGLFIAENGRVGVKTLEITGGGDLSEQFDISDSVDLLKPVAGMVVSIDPDNAGALVVSDHAYNRRVAGIISGAGDVRPGMIMGHKGTIADGAHPVALTGRVYCLAETSGGTIEPGDLLTTSDIPGYAMKVSDYAKAQGAIIGKAMTRLDDERGQVLVLVSLQ